MKQVPVTSAIKFGWSTVTHNTAYFIGITLLYLIIPNTVSSIGEYFVSNPPIYLLFQLIYFVLYSALTLGVIRISLKFVDGQKGTWFDLFSFFTRPKAVLNYVVGLFIYGIMVGVGTLFLILPGIYFAMKYGQFGYPIAEKNVSFITAFSISKDATRGIKIRLLGYGFVTVGVLILGALAFLVGLLWAIPTVLVAGAYIYRHISVDHQPPTLPAVTTSP